jgi:Flp pilus assembly protein TadB
MITIEDLIILILGVATGCYVGMYLHRMRSQHARKIAKRFQDAGAISPKTAVKPEDIGISSKDEILELVTERTKEGRYYLERRINKTIIFLLVLAAAIVTTGAILNVNLFILILSWIIAIIIWRVVTEKIAEKTR